MASFFNIRAFGRQSNKNNTTASTSNNNTTTALPPKFANSPVSPSAQTALPTLPPLSHSPALSPAVAADTPVTDEHQTMTYTGKTPFFFREENAGLVVRGNLVTLAARPEYVDMGEWLAHQVVEQWRILTAMLNIIQEVDARTNTAICNSHTCPTMTAGCHTYTWLDHNRQPCKIAAPDYIQLVQRWIIGKIETFPTDTTPYSSSTTYPSSGSNTPGATSPIPAGPTTLQAPLSQLAGRDWLGKAGGFAESFETDIKHLYRQMFRCYAHIYYGHWLDPFYHLGSTTQLNTCFIHFINVGRFFRLLTDTDLVPMQPLIDIWIKKELLPANNITNNNNAALAAKSASQPAAAAATVPAPSA